MRLPLRLNPALVLMALGLVFTAILVNIAWNEALENEEREFAADADGVRDNLFQRVGAAEEVITSLVTLVNSTPRVDGDQFRLFSEEAMGRHRFLVATGYLPLVTDADRREFERAKRQAGFPTFSITHWQQGRFRTSPWYERHFPLLYLEPFEPASAAMIGFDFLSDAVFAQAIQLAIDSAAEVPAPPGAVDRGFTGYRLFKPVYAGKSVPGSAEERRRAVNSIIALKIDAAKLLDESVSAGALSVRLDIEPLATAAATSAPPIHAERARPTPNPTRSLTELAKSYHIRLPGQSVRLEVRSIVAWGDIDYKVIAIVLIAGLMVSALLYISGHNIYLRARELQLRNIEIEHQVALKTAELAQEKERAQVTLESIGDAVIATDAKGDIQYLNPVAERLTGWTEAEARGRPLLEVFRILTEAARAPGENPVTLCLTEKRVTRTVSEHVLVARDGAEIAIDHSAAPIRNHDGSTLGAVLVFHDVSRTRRMSQEMSYQAAHDPLTGLKNRRVFEQRLAALLEDAQAGRTEHALLYLDLDQFKIVNDTCGHIAGDELLRRVSALLLDEVRHTDLVTRLGGDEFGVLLDGCTPEIALEIADKLRQTIRDLRFSWREHTFAIGMSIGLVPITAESGSPTSMLSAADAACYAAKDKGRNRIQVYQAGDQELARRHVEMQWVTRLTQAMEEDRFVLYRQRIEPLASAPAPALHEVLLRLRGEQGELVPPGAFLPAAERYNLMPAIDRWVVRAVLRWVSARMQQGPTGECYSINLSGQSLSDEDFPSFIAEEINRSGAPADRICLEITETAAVANLDHALHFIRALKKLGCRFALDDFGSGWSSFSYLKSLPVDYLKIDGSFVKDMAADAVDFAMVESINHIGHAIGIQTIAEFAESEAILEKLRQIGVDYAQGYAIERPRPLAEAAESQDKPQTRISKT